MCPFLGGAVQLQTLWKLFGNSISSLASELTCHPVKELNKNANISNRTPHPQPPTVKAMASVVRKNGSVWNDAKKSIGGSRIIFM